MDFDELIQDHEDEVNCLQNEIEALEGTVEDFDREMIEMGREAIALTESNMFAPQLVNKIIAHDDEEEIRDEAKELKDMIERI